MKLNGKRLALKESNLEKSYFLPTGTISLFIPTVSAMYHITERNERTSRRQAIVFTVLLHLILGVALYIQTMDKSQTDTPAPLVNTQHSPRP